MDPSLSDDELLAALGEATRGWTQRATRLLASDSIPGYELRGEIHQGGQGTVYHASQLSTRREVALKVLSSRGEERDRRRFAREVELASRLRHPGIVTVYESGVQDGRSWYAMEFAPGTTLDLYLEEARPTLAAHLDLFEHVVSAVAHAHDAGVVHRDLKPTNILVDDGGRPRIVDFGLALPVAQRASSARLTATGEFLGTLAYAAPEQVAGVSADARTDVHALGLLLYEQLCGRLPWDTSGTPADVLRRIASGPAVDVRPVASRVDRELAALVGKALEKDPRARYASAKELLRDVERYRAGRPLEARPHRWTYVAGRTLWRHRVVVGIGLFVLSLCATTFGSILRERRAAAARRDQAALMSELMLELVSATGSMADGAARLEALQAAAEGLESEVGVLGDVRAALWLALGEAHAARLDMAEADHFLSRGLERFREQGDPVGIVHALRELALVRARVGDPGAIALATEALAMTDADADPVAHALAQRLVARARIARVPAELVGLEEVRDLLAQSRATLVEAMGEGHAEVATCDVLEARLRFEDAESTARLDSALERLERMPGEAARTLECLEVYAQVLIAGGRFDAAEAMLERSVLLTRQTFGEEDTVDLVRRRALLASRKRGRQGKGVGLGGRRLAIELRSWARGRPSEAGALETLAQRVLEDERPPWGTAFARLRGLRGNGDFQLSSWMNNLASMVRKRGREEEATELYEEALEVQCRVYGEVCPNRCQALLGLAELAAEEGQAGQALAQAREVERLALEREDEDCPQVRDARALEARLRALGPGQ